jgi:hypothetical protein
VMVSKVARSAEIFASCWNPVNLGIAISAKIPKIATTTTNSISVNP